MAEKEMPSSSDESDEDFVPGEKSSSDEDSSSHNSNNSEDEINSKKSRKRRKICGRKRKQEDNESIEENEEVKDIKSSDIDALWADFKEDVNKMEQKTSTRMPTVEEGASMKNKISDLSENNYLKANDQNSKKTVPNAINSGKLGLNNLLKQIGKKEKLSTLAKSKLDWNNFKKSEGIEEEIKIHNKGKDGYLEKQDFLQRTDLRQFEIEKKLRSTRRHF